MRHKFRRYVSLGDLLIDRWETAAHYGFGEGTSCCDNVLIIGDVSVGQNTWIGPNCILDGIGGLQIGVTVGDMRRLTRGQSHDVGKTDTCTSPVVPDGSAVKESHVVVSKNSMHQGLRDRQLASSSHIDLTSVRRSRNLFPLRLHQFNDSRLYRRCLELIRQMRRGSTSIGVLDGVDLHIGHRLAGFDSI